MPTRTVLIVAISALCIALSVSASSNSPVVEITNANFDATTAEGPWVLEFFAPWCKHCQEYAKTYAEAASKVPNIRFGKTDCVAEKALCQRFGVEGYPTIKYMRDGSFPRDYSGGRDVKGFTDFARKVHAKPAKTVSVSELDTLLTQKDVVFVQFPADNQIQDVYRQVALQLQDILTFVTATDKTLYSRYKVAEDEDVTLALVDGKVIRFDGDYTVSALAKWVMEHRYSLISNLNEGNFQDLAENGKKTLLVMIDPTKGSQKRLVDKLKPLAEEQKDRVTWTWINAVEWDKFAARLETLPSQLPKIVLLDTGSRVFWDGIQDASNQTEILEFLANLENQKIWAKGDGPLRYWVNAKVYFGTVGLPNTGAGLWVLVSILCFGVLLAIFMCCWAIWREPARPPRRSTSEAASAAVTTTATTSAVAKKKD